jgi:hypothetical protein
MTSPPAGLPLADWQATPTSVCALLLEMVDQNRELQGQNQSLVDQNQCLTDQVTTLDPVSPSWRSRRAAAPGIPPNHPPATDLVSMYLVSAVPAAARAMASGASGAASRGIRAMVVICCRRNAVMR